MSNTIRIKANAGKDGNVASHSQIELLKDGARRALLNVRKYELVHDVEHPDHSKRMPLLVLTMYAADLEQEVQVSEEMAAAVLKVEHGRSLHFLDDDDRRALDDLFASPDWTNAAARKALGKILVELDLRDTARAGGVH